VRKIDDLMKMVFSGLSPLVIDDVRDEGEQILVLARTPGTPVACPGCDAVSGRVHGYHQRTLADVSVVPGRWCCGYACAVWSARRGAAAAARSANSFRVFWSVTSAAHPD
jgi:hypothetical protein